MDYVTVAGYASIADGRKDLARQSALDNAFRSAVEQAVGVLIESESVVNNSELIKDKISSKSAGFIRRYTIIEEKFEGDICAVKIRALVSRAKLEKGLDSFGLVLKKMGKPRIVMLLSEQSATQEQPSFWWGGGMVDMGVAENTITARFLKKDFNFVDRQSILANLKGENLVGKLGANLTNDTALRIIASGEAEVAIIGQAIARAGVSVGGTSFRPCQATVSARAINTDNGEVLASVTTQAMVPHVNIAAGGSQALEKAAAECAEKLQKQIMEKWSKRVGSSGMIRLIASGIAYEDLNDFMALLKDRFDQVEDIYERSFHDETAKMDLEVSGSAKQLAADVGSLQFKGGTVKVISLSANVLELKINRK